MTLLPLQRAGSEETGRAGSPADLARVDTLLVAPSVEGKVAPTKLWPAWRRAGVTSARGCPGWHLGTARLGQLACQPLGPHYCCPTSSGLFATQVELMMTRTRD